MARGYTPVSGFAHRVGSEVTVDGNTAILASVGAVDNILHFFTAELVPGRDNDIGRQRHVSFAAIDKNHADVERLRTESA